ncbi:hypothetical protein PCANB_000255, partial [Pneumocystis canis]
MNIRIIIALISIRYAIAGEDIFGFNKSNLFNYQKVEKPQISVIKSNLVFTETNLFALIVKETYKNNTQCENELKEYCQKFQSLNLKLSNIDPTLEKLCENAGKKCEELKDKVSEQCTYFKEVLSKKIKKDSIGEDDCAYYEKICVFLEMACLNNLGELCNKFANLCYQEKREKLITEILIRTLSPNLKTKDACELKLRVHCSLLSKKNDELMLKCFNLQETCAFLVNIIKEKCAILGETLTNTIKYGKNLGGECHPHLEHCYFYGSNCEEITVRQNCKKLRKNCEEMNIKYINPTHYFNPMEQIITVAEEINLEQLHTEAVHDGIVISTYEKDIYTMLGLLTHGQRAADICKQKLEEICTYFKDQEMLKDLCENNKISHEGEEKCKKLNNELSEQCEYLKKEIYDSLLSTEFGKSPSKLLGWSEMKIIIREQKCLKLEMKCAYLNQSCPDNLSTACMNLRAACYKRGRVMAAYEQLMIKLKGYLHDLNAKRLEECQKILIKECQTLKNRNEELFVLCMYPKETCLKVSREATNKAHRFIYLLRERNCLPKNKDCVELRKICHNLKSDINFLFLPCHVLEVNCAHKKNIEELKYLLLNENKDILKNQDQCIKNLGVKCVKLLKKCDNRFTFLCSMQRDSCEMMMIDMQTHCDIFKANMKKHNVTSNVNSVLNKEDICTYWEPYCNALSPNCEGLVKKTNGQEGLCIELKKSCESFRNYKALENMFIYILQGSLSDKIQCKLALDNYCTQKTKLKNNNLENFCKNITNNENEMISRENLCDILISNMKKYCIILLAKLEDGVKDLETKLKEFETLKKEAYESIKNINTNLHIPEVTDRKNHTINESNTTIPENGVVYITSIYQENIKIQPAKNEIMIFDAVTRSLEQYVDLKENCKVLWSECNFSRDCSMLKTVCENIHIICKKIKQPEFSSCTATTTKTIVLSKTTSTTSQTSTSTQSCTSSQCKTEGDEEKDNITPSEGFR